jgi:RimJ/RimL family protein N-acetyltransferase
LEGAKVRLRQKRTADAVNEYYWRKDEEICRLDATTPITSTFDDYVATYNDNHGFGQNSFILSIETHDGIYIGNCGCFNIDDTKGELEMGIIIGDKNYWGNGYGEDSVLTLVGNLFKNTDLKRVYLKTLDWNRRAHRCFQKCGFVPYGTYAGGEHNFILMDLKRNNTAELL